MSTQFSKVAPAWSSPAEAVRVVLYRPFLKKSIKIALVVGTLLFLINHFDEVLAGEVSTGTMLKGLATYIVPFCVANWGILSATKRQ